MREKAKLGFVVEGDRDRAILEALTRRLLPTGFQTHFVRLGGKAALPWAYTTVLDFLQKGYSHVFIVFDADTSDPAQVSRQREESLSILRRHGLAEHVSLCIAVPEIEAWLLAGLRQRPEQAASPKRIIAERLGLAGSSLVSLQRTAHELDLETAAARSPSLREFVRALEAIREGKRERLALPV